MKLLLLLLMLLPAARQAAGQNLIDAIGCWNMIHSMNITKSGIALQLYRNGTFTFKDYNDLNRDYELLRGTWVLKGAEVQLRFNDRAGQQTFTLKRDDPGKWILTKPGGFELRKEDADDCR